MCRKPTLGLAICGAMFSTMLAASQSSAADPSPGIVTRSHEAGDGQTYLAISLRSDAVSGQAVPHDHVILIDTSASQVGEHRTQAFAVLNDLLSALPANDRVAVYAVDLLAEPLTNGLIAPRAALQAAMPQLQQRFPAGSTDMLGALRTAMGVFDNSRPSSIVYIGDGMSTANLLQPTEMRTLLGELRRNETPVHSFAVGSSTDLQLLGALAQHTGGVVLIDDKDQNYGEQLAHAIDLPVVFPQGLKITDRNIQLLPNAPLPLRSDRDTVYLGRGDVSRNSQITLNATIDRQSRDLTWTIPPARYQQTNAFLVPLWNKAAQTNGLSNGLAGETMIAAAQDAFVDVVAALETSAEAAVTQGNAEEAAQLNNTLNAIKPDRARNDDLLAQADAPPAAPAAGGLQSRENPPAASLNEQAEELEKVRTERLQMEVNSALIEARKILASEPEIALTLLEDELRVVKASDDVDQDSRNELIRLLGNELADVNGRLEVLHEAQEVEHRRVAVLQATQRLLDAERQEEDRTKELVDRIRALIVQGYQGNAEAYEEAEAVARMLWRMRPGAAIGAQTVFVSEAAGHIDKAERLRMLRSDRFLATLYQVELSHVPFPDEPPVRYPPAEVWHALTEKRQKWKSVDLHQASANEQRIYEALDSSTDIQFTGTPLREVIDYIEEIHDIPILLETSILSAEGITGDEEITIDVKGIKLRSALLLMLDSVNDVPLAYVIENEVMKITTKDEADNTLQTRVYPVADLVIQPRVIQGGGGGLGGGLGGGGFGGGGFGGGGLGGGGFGGGGFGGGGFGGGGGGFFSLPDPAAPEAKSQPRNFDGAAIDRLKKKPVELK